MANYAPQWEAVSKQVATLRRTFDADLGTRVVAFNTRGRLLKLKDECRELPAALLLAPAPLVRALVGGSDINHVFASAGDRFLIRSLDGKRTILTVAKTTTLNRIESNIPFLRRLRYVVTETEHDRDVLCQIGLPADAVKLIHPPAIVKEFRPASGPFTILFATSPLNRRHMLSRGVYLLVQVAKSLPSVRFVFAWRKRNLAALRELLSDGAAPNIDVRNGVLDMDELYASAHATVLPGLHSHSLKPCPQSMLDSLGHGKPVLVSRPLSAADLIARGGSGVIFEPTVDGLRQGILELQERYGEYQLRCHSTVRERFSPVVHAERYRRLYDEVLRGIGARGTGSDSLKLRIKGSE